MEIIEGQPHGDDLVEVAFAENGQEAALIRGLLRNGGIRSMARAMGPNGPILGVAIPRRACRVYVRPEQADAARKLLGETMVEDPLETEIPEPVNAAHLAAASGHPPRDYNVIGAYARAWLVALAVFGLVLVLFLLLH